MVWIGLQTTKYIIYLDTASVIIMQSCMCKTYIFSFVLMPAPRFYPRFPVPYFYFRELATLFPCSASVRCVSCSKAVCTLSLFSFVSILLLLIGLTIPLTLKETILTWLLSRAYLALLLLVFDPIKRFWWFNYPDL